MTGYIWSSCRRTYEICIRHGLTREMEPVSRRRRLTITNENDSIKSRASKRFKCANLQPGKTGVPHLDSGGVDVFMADAAVSMSIGQPGRLGLNQGEICYGAVSVFSEVVSQMYVHSCVIQLCDAQAALLPNCRLSCRDVVDSDAIWLRYGVQVLDEDDFQLVSTRCGAFAIIDSSTAKPLSKLQAFDGIRLQAVVVSNVLRNVARKSPSTKLVTFSISVNIVGPGDIADGIGKALANLATPAFLQHPYSLDDGLEYWNPQYLALPGTNGFMTSFVGLTAADTKAKILSDEVERVFSSLDTTWTIHPIPQVPSCLTTALKRHISDPEYSLLDLTPVVAIKMTPFRSSCLGRTPSPAVTPSMTCDPL
jgi:hypothetical protein